MFKKPAIVSFSISQVDRWWNKGNEFKPNKAEFDAIQWDVLDNKFVNSFVWNTTFNATMYLEEELKDRIIKVETKNRNYYFYVESVVDRLPTKTGTILYECVLSLDIWTTYILNLNLKVYSNRFNDGWEFPQNFIKGFLKNDNPMVDIKENYCWPVYFKNNKSYGLIKENPNYNGQTGAISSKFSYPNLIKYYVFREKKTPTMFSGNNNIVLIPVLLDNASHKHHQKLTDYSFDELKYFIEPDNPGTTPYTLYLMNDEKNLNNLIDHKLEYKYSGLGDFIGCFVGPNFFRTKPIEEVWVLGLINSVSTYSNIAQCVPIITQGGANRFGGFWCLRIGSKWSEVSEYQVAANSNVVEGIKNGLYPLADEKATTTILKNKLVFTDRFVYSNEYDIYSENTELPTFTDTYWDWLAKSKPTRDTSINIANQNMALSLLGISRGGYYDEIEELYKYEQKKDTLKPDKLLDKKAGFAFGLGKEIYAKFNQTIQYVNFLRGIKAQQETQRLNHNTQVTSTDASFLLNWNLLNTKLLLTGNNYTQPNITTTNLDDRTLELFVGTKKIMLADLYNFYGWETGWYEIQNKKIKDITRGYLIWPKNLNLMFLFNEFTNEEKEAIIKMLNYGVRVGLKSEVENDFK